MLGESIRQPSLISMGFFCFGKGFFDLPQQKSHSSGTSASMGGPVHAFTLRNWDCLLGVVDQLDRRDYPHAR